MQHRSREKESPSFFKRDVEHAIGKVVSYDSEALMLAYAAKIVGRDMFLEQSIFNGNFPANCQENATPAVLRALVNMILDRPGISLKAKEYTEAEAALDQKQSQAALTISQFLIFNSRKSNPTVSPRETGCCHSNKKETPVSLFLGTESARRSWKTGTY